MTRLEASALPSHGWYGTHACRSSILVGTIVAGWCTAMTRVLQAKHLPPPHLPPGKAPRQLHPMLYTRRTAAADRLIWVGSTPGDPTARLAGSGQPEWLPGTGTTMTAVGVADVGRQVEQSVQDDDRNHGPPCARVALAMGSRTITRPPASSSRPARAMRSATRASPGAVAAASPVTAIPGVPSLFMTTRVQLPSDGVQVTDWVPAPEALADQNAWPAGVGGR